MPLPKGPNGATNSLPDSAKGLLSTLKKLLISDGRFRIANVTLEQVAANGFNDDDEVGSNIADEFPESSKPTSVSVNADGGLTLNFRGPLSTLDQAS